MEEKEEKKVELKEFEREETNRTKIEIDEKEAKKGGGAIFVRGSLGGRKKIFTVRMKEVNEFGEEV